MISLLILFFYLTVKNFIDSQKQKNKTLIKKIPMVFLSIIDSFQWLLFLGLKNYFSTFV